MRDAFVGNVNSDLLFIISVYKYEVDTRKVRVDTEGAAGIKHVHSLSHKACDSHTQAST